VPIPEGLPYEMKLLFWILVFIIGSLATLCTYFLIRYVSKTDLSFNVIKKSKAEDSDKITEIAEKQVDFQAQMGEHLITAQTKLADLSTGISRAQDKSDRLEEKIDKNIKATNQFNENVRIENDQIVKRIERVEATQESQSNVLQLEAQIIKRHSSRIGDIETELKRLGPDTILVTQKKKI
jgi:chromosome segregation ATPase